MHTTYQPPHFFRFVFTPHTAHPTPHTFVFSPSHRPCPTYRMVCSQLDLHSLIQCAQIYKECLHPSGGGLCTADSFNQIRRAYHLLLNKNYRVYLLIVQSQNRNPFLSHARFGLQSPPIILLDRKHNPLVCIKVHIPHLDRRLVVPDRVR